jgi:pyruvate dehydrogenase E2 component (dihydrolipoamide acetyltransferase)
MKTKLGTPVSPRARRMMQDLGLDAAALAGSGPDGRIVAADVLRAAALRENLHGNRPPSPPAPLSLAGEGSRQPSSISSMRRAVAAKVTESFATVPHFYLRSEVDMTSLAQLREQNLEVIEQRCGVRPTLTDFLLRAMALALRDCPQANRIWQNDGIVQLPTIDVGLVVQVGDGLLVPILQNADRLNIPDLSRQRIKLTDVVRSGRMPADIFQGGSTSLTNLGRHRVDEFAAIISPPQSSMLAVGRLAERPAVCEGQLCIRKTMHLTLSVDHRVMDGVPAAEFLDRIVALLEKPFLLLCDIASCGNA